MKYICIYKNYNNLLQNYSEAARGRLFTALIEYANTGVEPEFKGCERFVWPFLLDQLLRDEENYEQTCRRNRSNGDKGGRPRKQTVSEDEIAEDPAEEPLEIEDVPDQAETAERKEKTEKTARFSEASKKPKEKENAKEKEKEKANEKEKETVSPAHGEETAEGVDAPAAPLVVQRKQHTPDGFDRFWDRYPKKAGKIAAMKAFGKVDVPLDRLLEALEQQKQSDQWQREHGRYIPNPATWLNQGRWDDEPAEELDPRKAIPKFEDYLIGLEEYA